MRDYARDDKCIRTRACYTCTGIQEEATAARRFPLEACSGYDTDTVIYTPNRTLTMAGRGATPPPLSTSLLSI